VGGAGQNEVFGYVVGRFLTSFLFYCGVAGQSISFCLVKCGDNAKYYAAWM
jgi:hypothetical protein